MLSTTRTPRAGCACAGRGHGVEGDLELDEEHVVRGQRLDDRERARRRRGRWRPAPRRSCSRRRRRRRSGPCRSARRRGRRSPSVSTPSAAQPLEVRASRVVVADGTRPSRRRRRPLQPPWPGWLPCRRRAVPAPRRARSRRAAGCRSTWVTRSTLSDPSTTTRPIRTRVSAADQRVQPEPGVARRRRPSRATSIDGRRLAVRVVGEVAVPVAAVDDRASARPGAGELDPHRAAARWSGASGSTTAHTAPASPMVDAESSPNRSHWNAISRPASPAGPCSSQRRPGRSACSTGDPRVVEDVEPVHHQLDAQVGARVEGDRRRLGVVEDVELGRGGGVADVGGAAHEHDPPDPARDLRVGAQQEGDVGHRRERHQRDGSSSPRPRGARRAAARRRGAGPTSRDERGQSRSPMPSLPCTCRASPGGSSRGRAAPAATGTSSRPQVSSTRQGVAHDVGQRRVAARRR